VLQNPIFGVFCPKWRFWAIFLKNGLFSPFLLFPAIPARALLHQPLAPGPCTRVLTTFWGNSGGDRETPKIGVFGDFSSISGNSGNLAQTGPGDSPGSRRGRRAPPRGVDVKATPRGTPAGGVRGSGEPQKGLGPRSGVRGPPGEPSRPLQGAWDPFRDPAGGWFYINPSRRGPVPVPGPGSRAGAWSPELASRGAHPRPVQGQRGSAACSFASRPQAGGVDGGISVRYRV